MTAESPLVDALKGMGGERLAMAREELRLKLRQVTVELQLLEAALDGGATEAPASGDRPLARDAGLPRPEDQAGAGASVAPPSLTARKSRSRHTDRLTADQVLEHIGADWKSVSGLPVLLGHSKTSVYERMSDLARAGRIEKRGFGRGAEWRRGRVDDGRGEGSPKGAPAAAAPANPDDATPTVAVNVGPDPDRAMQSKIEDVLHRARDPLTARNIAASLVANIALVSQQLQIMVRASEQGNRYPAVHRDSSGRYSLSEDLAA